MEFMIEAGFSYGEHSLQTLTVITAKNNTNKNNDGIWIIYIHGGAWRDPEVTDKSILRTIETLLQTSQYQHLVQKNVAGFASVSYRLSPHLAFPQDATTTPKSKYRNAKHPDHLQDIIFSINFLQSKYGFGSNYVLIGHSCGATLALQTVMRHSLLVDQNIPAIQNPEVIVGVAGIYDLRLIRDTHKEITAYNDFLVGAFGENEEEWDHLSPAKFQNFRKSWPEGKKLILVSSSGDELVDEAQMDCMSEFILSMGSGINIEMQKGTLKERHNDIWKNGVEMAGVIKNVLDWIDSKYFKDYENMKE
ncbi:Alpha/Beta hydrolase protein [Tricladium varicosporioides]|nr:Alpha/Beta hydrolase protein [Hymenoscyphus varicosporioides]